MIKPRFQPVFGDWMRTRPSVRRPFNAVLRDALVNLEHNGKGSRGVIRLGELVLHARSQVVSMGLGALGLLVVIVGIEHVHEHGLSIHGLV